MENKPKTLTEIISQQPVINMVLGCFEGDLPLSECTNAKLKQLVTYMQEHVSLNSVRTYAAYIKSALNLYKGDEVIPNDYASALTIKGDVVSSVYLTEEELKKLYWYAKTPSERFHLLLFLISAFEGCRYSDITNIKESNIEGDILRYRSGRTGVLIEVPARKELREWLLEINSINITFNKTTHSRIIKNLCERADISEIVRVHSAGRDIEDKKFNFVTSQTALRSFVTNLYLRGVNLIVIGRFMGHSTSAQTARYLCGNANVLDDKIKGFF